MDDILDRAAQLFDVPRAAILGRAKTRRVVLARQAVAWALRKRYTSLSLVEIGERLGGRDHTTIIYSVAAAEQRAKQDPEYRAYLQALIATAPPLRQSTVVVTLPPGTAWWLRQTSIGRPLITPAA